MKTTKTKLTELTDTLNWKRNWVTGGTREETRRQFEGGSGDEVLAMAAKVEEAAKNVTKRVDAWTLEHALSSVANARKWEARTREEIADFHAAAADMAALTTQAQEEDAEAILEADFDGATADEVVKTILASGVSSFDLVKWTEEKILSEFRALKRRAAFAIA